MGSDRARITYDPKQQYRSVVMQQGRVTLEADWNESQLINSEEIRREALDFVGPAGTPDDGYKVSIPTPQTSAPFDFDVAEGTMYVGGVRACLAVPVQYSNQSDWRDTGPEDPDWIALSALAAAPPANEFVYLSLRELEVSAVEDPDLKDIALGGPDTAQRTRLIQRIVRLSSPGADCASGLAAAENHWHTEGLSFDPQTMRLTSSGLLSVSAANQQPLANPCQPQAQGGYLDPDNQLIRVQISGVDELTGNPKFLWGFDDASFLYRIDVDPNSPQNLILQSTPVDSFHQPVRGQAVEVLRTTAELHNGGSIAALSGFPFTLDQNYNPDLQSIVLPSSLSLPADYLSATQSPPVPLFLRVWQEEKVFTPGTATVLGDTGLQVTLETSGGGPFHTGDYWMFAVRPATPQTVYPERYWNNFQPAEGPRLWACPLAVISWNGKTGFVASDCRNSFDNLVNLSKRQNGCCTINLRPQNLSGTQTLQSIIDASSNISMTVTAVDKGLQGNNISIAVSNVHSELSPATFDITVTETVTLPALTVTRIGPAIGNETSHSTYLAHVVRASVSQNQNAVPAATQTFSFSNAKTPSARADVYDSAGSIVFTLEAKRPGNEGNYTTASITNLNTTVTPNTFDLTLSWTKTLTGLTLANFIQSTKTGMAYEIIVAVPQNRPTALPAQGITQLSGGTADANDPIAASATIFGGPVTICLSPGTYNLPQTLRIAQAHSNLTIEACGGGVTLAAASGKASHFQQGLIALLGASNVTLRGLTFQMPLFTPSPNANPTQPAGMSTSIGLRAVDVASLTVEDCVFNYPPSIAGSPLFAGILATADCIGLRAKGNDFNGPANFATGVGADPLVYGYIQAANISLTSPTQPSSGGTLATSILDDACFRDNNFKNLIFAVAMDGSFGKVVFEANTMTSCFFGITLLSLADLQTPSQVTSAQDQEQAKTADSFQFENGKSLVQQAVSAAAVFPLPALYRPRRMLVVPAAPATESDSQPAAQDIQPIAKAMKQLPAQLAQFVSQAVGDPDPVVLPVPDLRIANNSVDQSVWAVWILEETHGYQGTLIMTANRLNNTSATEATVLVYGLQFSAITGNIIMNSQYTGNNYSIKAPPSLEVAGTVAVTGNIFLGQPNLPVRNSTLPYGLGALPDPMERWEAYNTEVV